MKKFGVASLYICLMLSLTGCSAVGSKSASMSTLYTVTTIVSLLLLAGYCCLIRKRDPWFVLLFSSVLVVNTGYLTLAISSSLPEALMANRLAYLGSVFLPASMLMIIMNVCKLDYRKWFPYLLIGVGAAVFLIAASPGILDIYYKEVSLATVNGMTVLEKVYGPWHPVYLFYLLTYFCMTIAVIIHAAAAKKIDSPAHAILLAGVVFANMGVWLLEQLVRLDFELLSISYILSELFLLGICMVLQELGPASRDSSASAREESESAPAEEPAEPIEDTLPETKSPDERCAYLRSQLPRLTPTERIIYNYYLDGMGTRDILTALNIKENTLKYHNRNIYGKLGVASRKELLEIASLLKTDA